MRWSRLRGAFVNRPVVEELGTVKRAGIASLTEGQRQGTGGSRFAPDLKPEQYSALIGSARRRWSPRIVRNGMAKTAMSQLEDQVELIRREINPTAAWFEMVTLGRADRRKEVKIATRSSC